MGRPKEVMAFLRGKLLSINGDSSLLEEILDELERFYEEVSRKDRISEKELRKLELYKELLINALRRVPG
ncbi:hypothetical protein [Pyrococcus sp. NA2]|uniref:hypothetical protein n=1 Tax=Pyrococcus sp. (strain NA2) TaxID=342949 RepID=UPI001ED95B2F|nr:hypothetical protein [Pyrococcus sp. NA2]